jgi:ubiquinone biosynthesis protein UbiJ
VIVEIWNPDDDDVATLEFFARSRTLLPGMADVLLEEIEWLEDNAAITSTFADVADLFRDRLAALAERLEGILG